MPIPKYLKFSLSRFCLVLLFPFSCFAQEVFVPLGSNPAINAYRLQHNESINRLSAIDDTLLLPFVDDFSRQGIYPFDSLWLDQDAFINTSFAVNPPTIGVATLDGLDALGRPHDSLSGSEAIADHLTSRPIDLGNLGPDTGTVWLSFFYQPQGLGDIPETDDSLVVQFRKRNNDWVNVWSVAGQSDTAFQRANIHINDTAYHYKGFQLRFYNIATVNGNRDHWNLDYVILAKQTVANDSIRDNALVTPHVSLLSEFSAMPYTHYKSLSTPLNAMVTDILDTIHDLNYGQTSFIPSVSVFNSGGLQIFTNNSGSISSPSSNSYIPFAVPLNSFAFPIVPQDSTDFTMKVYFTQTGGITNAHNDTSYLKQKFYNYYAYDDGSAEIGYGLSGNTDLKLAYQFNVKKQDTLRGVQIYFNPVGLNVHNKLFQLAYWSDVNVGANSDQLVYKMINQKPANVDAINGFATYLFDTLLIAPAGNIYVGVIQNEPQTLYGFGLDRNTDAHTKMFYHLDGYWYNSQVKGSLMIRPLFGDTITRGNLISVTELETPELPFTLYPNPVENDFVLDFKQEPGEKYSYTICDLTGKQIQTAEAIPGNQIHTAHLSSGFYFLRLTAKKAAVSSTMKFMVY
ncbi:MAG: T9SS type A sorting domain-containing protein [Bacteroidetes bacterium]|nr:T9SS type A sorting domain-containing protein [Bacteroidota bacterium]